MNLLEEKLLEELNSILLEDLPPIFSQFPRFKENKKGEKIDIYKKIANTFAVGNNSEQIDISYDEAMKAVGLIILADDNMVPIAYLVRNPDGKEIMGTLPGPYSNAIDKYNEKYQSTDNIRDMGIRYKLFRLASQYFYITQDEDLIKNKQAREKRGEWKPKEYKWKKTELSDKIKSEYIEEYHKLKSKNILTKKDTQRLKYLKQFFKEKDGETILTGFGAYIEKPSKEQTEQMKQRINNYIERKIVAFQKLIPHLKTKLEKEFEAHIKDTIAEVKKAMFENKPLPLLGDRKEIIDIWNDMKNFGDSLEYIKKLKNKDINFEELQHNLMYVTSNWKKLADSLGVGDVKLTKPIRKNKIKIK